MALEDLLLCVLLASKVDLSPQKSKSSIQNMLILTVFKGHFLKFWESKKLFSEVFRCF